jgi:hypothetical protein
MTSKQTIVVFDELVSFDLSTVPDRTVLQVRVGPEVLLVGDAADVVAALRRPGKRVTAIALLEPFVHVSPEFVPRGPSIVDVPTRNASRSRVPEFLQHSPFPRRGRR